MAASACLSAHQPRSAASAPPGSRGSRPRAHAPAGAGDPLPGSPLAAPETPCPAPRGRCAVASVFSRGYSSNAIRCSSFLKRHAMFSQPSHRMYPAPPRWNLWVASGSM
ncbi:uncharacterized protein [Oryctolagus cuniculus]|uniref:uncharacterized protein n=1 Tax=Oryctolagus cuniculus TaxID=9986 RepID=UPI003879C5D4